MAGVACRRGWTRLEEAVRSGRSVGIMRGGLLAVLLNVVSKALGGRVGPRLGFFLVYWGHVGASWEPLGRLGLVLGVSWGLLGASRGGRLDLSVRSHRLELLWSLSREPPAPSSSWGEGYICRFVVSVWSSSGACLGSLLGRLGRSVVVSGLSWAALGDL